MLNVILIIPTNSNNIETFIINSMFNKYKTIEKSNEYVIYTGYRYKYYDGEKNKYIFYPLWNPSFCTFRYEKIQMKLMYSKNLYDDKTKEFLKIASVVIMIHNNIDLITLRSNFTKCVDIIKNDSKKKIFYFLLDHKKALDGKNDFNNNQLDSYIGGDYTENIKFLDEKVYTINLNNTDSAQNFISSCYQDIWDKIT
jgi:hypothetical protein